MSTFGRTEGELRRLVLAAFVMNIATWGLLAFAVSARNRGPVIGIGVILVLLDLPALAYRSVRIIVLVVQVLVLLGACAALVARPEVVTVVAAAGTGAAVALFVMAVRRPAPREQVGMRRCGSCGAATERTGRRRVRCEACARRIDERASAMIVGFVSATVIVGLIVQGRTADAGGVVAFIVLVAWGGVLVHEGGHFAAAVRDGNRVTDVRVGLGLPLFTVGRMTVCAVPLGGRVNYDPDPSMTPLRVAMISACGPLANLLTAVALVALLPLAHGLGIGWLVAAAIWHLTLGVMNLIPVRGEHERSDGYQILAALRPPELDQPPDTQAARSARR